MEIETSFRNPHKDVGERDFLQVNSEEFEFLTKILHSELLTTDPLYFCGHHHAVVTRYLKKKIITRRNVVNFIRECKF